MTEENNNTNDINSNNENHSVNPDFNKESETEENNSEVEKFVQKQKEYIQIIQPNEQIPFKTDIYIWRIGFGRRLGAYIIDYVFLMLLIVVAAVFTGVSESMMNFIGSDLSILSNPEQINEITSFLNKTLTPLMLAVSFIYYSMEVIFAQTLGKMLLGIQIGSADKKFASYPQLLLRFVIKFGNSVLTFLFIITSLGFFETLSSIWNFVIFVGCFFVLSTKKQALHDVIAKTSVYFKDELQQLNFNE